MKSENAELVCRVRGFPKGVVWFKNGVEVRSKKRHAVEQYIEDDVTVSSLTIVQLENSDFANYVCQAYNNYGSDEMDIRLEKLSKSWISLHSLFFRGYSTIFGCTDNILV